jgi:type IX secretion system PorP/SprF family membrane protein
MIYNNSYFKNFRCSLCFVIGMMFWTVIKGQDAHFSQFYASPLNLNPALSGAYSGTFRISTNYRDQWFSAIDNSLKTFSASGDAKFNVSSNKNNKNPDVASVGISFFSDRVSTFDLNTNQINLTGAFHKSLNKKTKQYLGVGIQGGVFQRSLNYEDLLFQDQFNSIDAFNLGTSELFPTNNRGYFDLSAGVYYTDSPSKNFNYHLGLGVFHINQPNLSFYDDATIIDPNISKSDTLNRRWSLHTGASFQTTERWAIQPRAQFIKQGSHSETNLGSHFRYKIDPQSGRYFILGTYARLVKNYEGTGLESMIGLIGYERNNFILGISYDQAFSKLIRDRRSLSSIEVSIIYIGEHHNEDNFCPQF